MCRGSTSTQGHGVFQSTCCKRGPQTGNDRKQMPPHEAEKRQAELAASSSEDVHLPWHRKLNKCQLEIPTKNISKTIQWVICCFFTGVEQATRSTHISKMGGRQRRRSCLLTHRLNTRSDAHPCAFWNDTARSKMLDLSSCKRSPKIFK